jgi:ribosomal protein S18 acetylase RimI-like enzyme
MIATMAEAAGARGLQAIEAGTQENNGPACALYRRLGFLPIATRIDFHWTPGSP